MGIRSGNPTWQDYPSTATLITAAKMNALEAAIDASPASSSLGTASTKNVPVTGDASTTQVVMGSDTRLSGPRPPTAHTHDAGDIVSGIMAVARLGSGTPSASKFLRGDGVWETPTGSGGTTGSVQFEVLGTGGVNVAQGSFSTFPLGGTPGTNIGGGTWNTSTYIYTIPSNGLYLCLGSIRLNDGETARNVALAIGTSNADGSHVLWGPMGQMTGFTGATQRNGQQYTRMTRFSTGDQVRMYIYSDGTDFISSGGGQGQFLSIIKMAD